MYLVSLFAISLDMGILKSQVTLAKAGSKVQTGTNTHTPSNHHVSTNAMSHHSDAPIPKSLILYSSESSPLWSGLLFKLCNCN